MARTAAESSGQHHFRRPPVQGRAVTTFRIAHVSDLHLAVRANHKGWNDIAGVREHLGLYLHLILARRTQPAMSTYGSEYLRALVRALSGKARFTRKGYDGFVITGDVATTGEPEDLAAAAAILTGQASNETFGATPSLRMGQFALPADRVALLPGNHDRYLGPLLRPRSTHFEATGHFGSDWKLGSQSPSSDRSLVNTFEFKKDGTRLAVVAADFSYHRTPLRFWRWWGCGETLESTLAVMREKTDALWKAGAAVIWAMHFPPLAKGIDWKLRMAGHEAAAAAAAEVNVDVILCGHTHEPDAHRRAPHGTSLFGPRVICAGTACGAGPGHRSYFQLDIEVQRDLSQERSSISDVRPTEMIYSRWTQDSQVAGKRGDGPEFCPAP